MPRPQLPFRPLDQGSHTRMGYDVEAAHWQRAFTSAQRNQSFDGLASLGTAFGLLGAILTIVLGTIFIILTLLSHFLKYLVRLCENTEKERLFHQRFSHGRK